VLAPVTPERPELALPAAQNTREPRLRPERHIGTPGSVQGSGSLPPSSPTGYWQVTSSEVGRT
jgi:hypothetical protein